MYCITPQQRETWLNAARHGVTPPAQEWIDAIFEKKETRVETKTTGEFFAMLDLEASHRIVIHGMSTRQNAHYIFEISFPVPEPPKQENLFDL